MATIKQQLSNMVKKVTGNYQINKEAIEKQLQNNEKARQFKEQQKAK